jgi:hypothetical protein
MLERVSNIKSMVLLDPMLAEYKKPLAQLLYWFFVQKTISGLQDPEEAAALVTGFQDALSTVYLRNTEAWDTVKLLVKCIYVEKKANPELLENVKLKIILGKDDVFMPRETLPKILQRDVLEVDGDHDWLMADPKLTTKIIAEYV